MKAVVPGSFLTVLIVFGVVGPAAAQPPVKWWQSDKFRTELNLTGDQSSRIEAVFQSVLPRLRSDKEALDHEEARLSDLMARDSTSESEVLPQIDRVERARSELGKERTLMLFRMRSILSPDQRVKMKALHDEWERERRKRDAHQ